MFNRLHLAQLVFGAERVGAALDEATAVLDRWGYRSQVRDGEYKLPGVLGQALLINRSPRLADLTNGAFARLHAHPAAASRPHQATLYALQRVVASLGYCDPPVRTGYNHAPGIEGTDPAWAGWVERWHATSPLTPKVRAIIRTIVAKAGRWLAAEQPGITEPGQWTRETCAAWVAAVDRMAVGDYVQRRDHLHARAGKPVSPRTKAHMLMATRTFFRDCQEWEWFPRRFDPTRALALPRSVGALIGTDPRVIADDVWAKLLWAGLNIEAADLPGTSAGSYYPMELIRALTLTWLFSGQRSDEISRLRVGCIRWHHDGMPIPGDSREILAEDAVCLLDIPVNKTGTAFTKPVDPIIGQAIEAWQALRPAQPPRLDRKTSEHVDLLFSIRAHPVGKTYINRTIIPALCAKAGVPTADVRGNITSHRARSTIASQLYNAKEPMTLFELQAWLGHRTPTTTQHYAKITPNTLSKAYTEAGYFARNMRTIEVLLDRDAVASGLRGQRRALAVLRPRPRAVLLHLLRAVPAPHGLREMRLLHPEKLKQGPDPRSQGQPAAHARRDPAHRRRTCRSRRRKGRTGLPPRPARRHPDPRRRHTPRAPRIASADPPAHHRCPPRKTRIKADIQIPQNFRVHR